MNNYVARRAERFGGSSGQFFLKSQGILVIDSGGSSGSLPDQLTAAMFGLYKVIEAVLVSEDNLYCAKAVHAFDGNSLLIEGLDAPVDLPDGTYLVTVTGY
jgi:hypothetical protein